MEREGFDTDVSALSSKEPFALVALAEAPCAPDPR
jgi:hypothetical protein